MFTKEERSRFKYWFAHWCAFQMTALNLRCWKLKYLFHDIEKPWLKLILRDYKKVQTIHRKYNKHHITYYIKNGKADFEAMTIDWECSRFTKEAAPLTAVQTLPIEIEELEKKGVDSTIISNFQYEMIKVFKKLGLIKNEKE